MLTKGKSPQGHGSTADLAAAVLGWLAGDEERLAAFLSATGTTPQNLRESARAPGFLAAVLDFVMGDEEAVLACARALQVPPERIAAAWAKLQPPEDDPFR